MKQTIDEKKKILLKAYQRARLEVGFSLHEAGELLGVSAVELSAFENGHITSLDNYDIENHPIISDKRKNYKTICIICGKNIFVYPPYDPMIHISYSCKRCDEEERLAGAIHLVEKYNAKRLRDEINEI